MKPQTSMSLEQIGEWVQHLPVDSAFSGYTTPADTACLVYYSHDDHTLCIANINLEEGKAEWTFS